MVKHGALSRSHVYRMLGSKDARIRRAAFTLLEASNPKLRRNSELFIEIVRFIWDANPSYYIGSSADVISCDPYIPTGHVEERSREFLRDRVRKACQRAEGVADATTSVPKRLVMAGLVPASHVAVRGCAG
jgi:hypothetical protein